MSKLKYLKLFDKAQLWRLFVDGRYQKKYNGWVGYEEGERGSVQALLNGFGFMVDNFDISGGLKATYLRELHKICMMSVETANLKSSPGDIRYLNSGMPFFAKTTTREHLAEVFEMRSGDGTAVFNSKKWGKPADELDVDEIYEFIQKDGKINYRNWYPNLDKKVQEAIEGKLSLHEFYDAKHSVQMMIVSRMEEIIERYNKNIRKAKTDEKKLKAIALVPRELELLHPFPDGNSRTFSCITLTHLLMFNGFPPALLENPNLDNEVSLYQWIEEIKKGMQRTRELLKNPKQKIFDYSIQDMQKKDKTAFLSMASDLIQKIDDYKEIYLTPSKLVEYTGGSWIVNDVYDTLRFSGVGTYNTYKSGNIYFTMAIKDWIKEKKDVKAELDKVLSKGIKAVVIDDLKYVKYFDIPILYVKDTFRAFKKCAIKVRQDHNPYTVLVTGTEGKTGAKVQFHHILNKQIKTHAVLNSANTEVPVLRSLINLEDDDRVEINEVSVGSDEAYRVERTMMVNPDLCFFTNIGPNHMDMHKTIDNIMAAKSSVVEGLREGGKCIVNSTIEHYQKLLDAIEKRRPNTPIITYGTSEQDTARLISQDFDSEKFGWNVKADIDGKSVSYFLPLFQQHAPLSSVGILLAVKEMGYDVQKAANDYNGFVPYETMGQLLKIHKNSGDVTFYDQSRRGGIHGMRSAFKDMKNFNVKGKIVALVGGISTKKDSDWTREAHAQLAQMINESDIKRLYTTGNYMDYVTNKLDNPDIFVKHSDDLNELAKSLYNEVQGGDLLFIIGNAYLYLGRVSDKVLGFEDTSKYDEKIQKYKLSKKELAKYKALIVSSEIEDGINIENSLHSNNLSKSQYKPFISKTFTQMRTEMLMHFFRSLDKYIGSFNGVKLVNKDIRKTGNEANVYNEEFCSRWFNNLDKKPGIQKKEFFGSFYFFKDKKYLLHIEAATLYLHIGFVKYTMNEGKFQLQKMDADDFEDIKEKYNYKIDSITPKERKWGLHWYSYNIKRIIDVTKADNFTLMENFKKSALNKEFVTPLLERLVK